MINNKFDKIRKLRSKNSKKSYTNSKSHKKNDENTSLQQIEEQIWTNENGSSINLASLPKLKSLHEFEYGFNRIVQHYPTREAYAQDCELDLSTIAVPTLCLSSEDDFMAPKHLLPIEQVQANPNLCMLLTKRGGHMAFVDGLVWPKKPYFAQRIISDYMGALREKFMQQQSNDNNNMDQSSNKQHASHYIVQDDKSAKSTTDNIASHDRTSPPAHIAINLHHHHHHHHHYIHSQTASAIGPQQLPNKA